jgi:hypothetical protein
MRFARLAALATLASTLVAASVAAQDTQADRVFVTMFVEAVNRGAAGRLPLVHAKARACATGAVGEWWNVSVARQAKQGVPAEYRWTLKPIPAGEQPPFAEGFDYSVKPTHILQIDMRPKPFTFRTMLVRLARDGDRWAEVMPCAKPEMQAKIRATLEAKARQAERVKGLIAAMPAPLREKVLAEIREGHSVSAAKTYADESGEDLTTATEVVELLEETAR